VLFAFACVDDLQIPQRTLKSYCADGVFPRRQPSVDTAETLVLVHEQRWVSLTFKFVPHRAFVSLDK